MKKSPTRFIRRVDNKFTSASLDLNFQNMTTSGFDSRITFTRASSGTFFNGSGILQTASTNVPRLDHSPTTLQSLGLLIEEQRTNSIRNNTMQGAVAGTPGTLPTNWNVFTGITGLTREIVGTGTENGITYIDIRVSGTPSAAGVYLIFFESGIQIAAVSGQTWTATSYIKLQGGSFTGITSLFLAVDERDVTGAFLASSTVSLLGATSAPLNTQRFAVSRTFNNASTERTVSRLAVSFPISTAIDITLRIGLPQLEQGAFATSVIPTTVAAATRNADVASMTGTNFSSWYNQSEGTFYAEVAPIAIEAGKSILGSNLNNYNPLFFGSSSTLDVDFRNVGGLLSSIGTSVTAINFKATVAASITGSVAGSFNAALTSISMSALDFSTVNILRIGNRNTGPVFNGRIQRIAYYPVRLSNDQLQALTR